MLKLCSAATMVTLLVTLQSFADKQDDKRAEIDEMAQTTLDQLFNEHPNSRELYDEAYGYAVFSSVEVAAGIKAGGGQGVAVNNETNERTYMEMGTGGLALGLGGQKQQLVFLFESEEPYDNFVSGGWDAGAGATAVVGKEDAATSMSFRDGVAIFPMSGAGLMAAVDMSGTKFSPDKKLNEGQEMTSDETEETITEETTDESESTDVETDTEEFDHIDKDEDPGAEAEDSLERP